MITNGQSVFDYYIPFIIEQFDLTLVNKKQELLNLLLLVSLCLICYISYNFYFSTLDIHIEQYLTIAFYFK
jgi:hypothetical protein